MKWYIIKRPKSLSRSKPRSRRQRRQLLQHLCLDKGYKSPEEEQKLIKRGYVLHMAVKKKKEKKRWMKNRYQTVKNIQQKDGL